MQKLALCFVLAQSDQQCCCLLLPLFPFLLDLFELSQETSCSECFEKLVQRSGCVDNDILLSLLRHCFTLGGRCRSPKARTPTIGRTGSRRCVKHFALLVPSVDTDRKVVCVRRSSRFFAKHALEKILTFVW